MEVLYEINKSVVFILSTNEGIWEIVGLTIVTSRKRGKFVGLRLKIVKFLNRSTMLS